MPGARPAGLLGPPYQSSRLLGIWAPSLCCLSRCQKRWEAGEPPTTHQDAARWQAGQLPHSTGQCWKWNRSAGATPQGESQPRLSGEGAQNAGMHCWPTGGDLGKGKDQAGRKGRWRAEPGLIPAGQRPERRPGLHSGVPRSPADSTGKGTSSLHTFSMNMKTTLITMTMGWERQGLGVSLEASRTDEAACHSPQSYPTWSLPLTFQSTHVICSASALLPF